jgi:hypothetical protein
MHTVYCKWALIRIYCSTENSYNRKANILVAQGLNILFPKFISNLENIIKYLNPASESLNKLKLAMSKPKI